MMLTTREVLQNKDSQIDNPLKNNVKMTRDSITIDVAETPIITNS